LIAAVRQTGEFKMPKGGKLRQEEVDALAEWIRAGAAWPEVNHAALTTVSKADVVGPERRAFWSFQPLRSSAAPSVRNSLWPKTEIDRFIMADGEGLTPSAPADRRTLIRRSDTGSDQVAANP
jgi:hypothetical protein